MRPSMGTLDDPKLHTKEQPLCWICVAGGVPVTSAILWLYINNETLTIKRLALHLIPSRVPNLCSLTLVQRY